MAESNPEEKEEVKEEANLPAEKPAEKKVKKDKFAKKSNSRSNNYTANAMKVDKNKLYTLSEGIELLKTLKTAKFDETVELHINTTEPV